MNKGEHKGLWRLIEDDARRCGGDQPILVIWCAAHRSDLAMKDLNKAVEEIPKVIKMCSSLASFFRRSGIRTALLKQTAEKYNLKLYVLPRHFEVRWSQFTGQLVNSVLGSWHCLVLALTAFIADPECIDQKGKAEAEG